MFSFPTPTSIITISPLFSYTSIVLSERLSYRPASMASRSLVQDALTCFTMSSTWEASTRSVKGYSKITLSAAAVPPPASFPAAEFSAPVFPPAVSPSAGCPSPPFSPDSFPSRSPVPFDASDAFSVSSSSSFSRVSQAASCSSPAFPLPPQPAVAPASTHRAAASQNRLKSLPRSAPSVPDGLILRLISPISSQFHLYLPVL